MHFKPEFYEELKQHQLAIEDDEYGETGYYRFIDTASDDGKELLVFKQDRPYDTFHMKQFEVWPSAQFHVDKVRLYPDTVKVVLGVTQDENHATVNVDRLAGIATIHPSHKSSAKVIGEVVRLAGEYFTEHGLVGFEDYRLTIKWNNDHYDVVRLIS